MATARDVVTAALEELGVVGATLELSDADLALGLRRLNRLINAWNANGQAIYAETIQTFTLTPSLQPHTIGPSGATWTVSTLRPVRIVAANVIQSDVRSPLWLRTREWWMAQTTPTQTSALPTDLYYEPTWPNGSVYLSPVPSAAYSMELLLQVVLATYVAADTLTLPPGYEEALTLTLAEALVNPMTVPMPPSLPMAAQAARGVIFATNVTTPPLITNDIGLPSSRGWFNNQTGQVQ